MSLYIGLMSGTSADGMDAALVRFSADLSPELVHAIGLPYTPQLTEQLRRSAIAGQLNVTDVLALDRQIAKLSVEAIQALLQQSATDAHQVSAIGSHGHTLHHIPGTALGPGNSWQIGDPSWIAEHSGITCIADFRRRDIAAGGQGAPLVPAFHQTCLQDPQTPTMVLNIGGIANISVLGNDLRGFDCGPGNALMDEWCLQHWQQPQDTNGEHARKGQVIENLLRHWKQQAGINHFLKQHPPRSTGRELFNLNTLLQQTDPLSHSAEDILASLSQFTVDCIADSIQRFGHQQGNLWVCGGGVHNPDLMQRLQQALPYHQVASSQVAGIDPDWMEAMAFAWLAQQTLNQRPGNAPEVTGARASRILGGIYPA